MSNDQLDDLKQFIWATISQSEERLRQEIIATVSRSEERLRKELADGLQSVRQEMADGFLGVGEAIEAIHQQLDAQDAKHEANRQATDSP